MRIFLSIILFLIFYSSNLFSQSLSLNKHWLNNERELRYKPDGHDFVIVNGDKRFNRALYGSNTGFRVEAGDLPEFAMYMPRFGGNLHLGIVKDHQAKWLISCDSIEARYSAGAMIYLIRDSILGDVLLYLTVEALHEKEGMIIKVESSRKLNDISLVWAYGGATDKRFHREGDLNADPESVFYLTPENCKDNVFDISNNSFVLQYGKGTTIPGSSLFEGKYGDFKDLRKVVCGIFPDKAKLRLGDASVLESPLKFISSDDIELPVLTGSVKGVGLKPHFILLMAPTLPCDFNIRYSMLPGFFNRADSSRQLIASQIQLETPDPYINTLGTTLSLAADAIWEDPTYMHGAIGWRMRLNGWRGPYVADPMGWHDRAKTHYSSYAKSQILEPASGPSIPDPDRNLARQEEKIGNALYTSGYICRNPNGDFKPHHYDMNLVFIDGLLRHFRWTGDTAYIREMWPVLQRHLAWEKRNFDGDNDGLYDAYCCIWASDALEYGGGAVSHSSAYNYLSNKIASQLAQIIGENPEPYRVEADKILNAIQTHLWLPRKGWFAEYKDWSGLTRTHDASALWTIYHVLDSEVADPFQAWQASRYVETSLPRLPVKGKGLIDEDYFVHSTTNWQPYDWSINNVVMAENIHTALAHWQAGRIDEAFKLWKSSLLDAMYLGGSPGNFVQLSTLDAARGEMYRDFADEVGMTARSLVEGLFGILPDAINGELLVKPGFPDHWDHAKLVTPDIDYQYQRKGLHESFQIKAISLPLNLSMIVRAKASSVKAIVVNGRAVSWRLNEQSIGEPSIIIECGLAANYSIDIEWQGDEIVSPKPEASVVSGKTVQFSWNGATIGRIYDPQSIFSSSSVTNNVLSATVNGLKGHRTAFVNLSQGDFSWWMPVSLNVVSAMEVISCEQQPEDAVCFQIINNLDHDVCANISVAGVNFDNCYRLKAKSLSDTLRVVNQALLPGSNRVDLMVDGETKVSQSVINWNLVCKHQKQRSLDLSGLFNADVTDIFKQEYLSPRWAFPTLQLPKHGIGNWCYNNIHPVIDDSGLRKSAANGNCFVIPQGVQFSTPSVAGVDNVTYTSLWDNYPDSVVFSLSGRGSHLYLLMAGSTNPMQSQIVNGVVKVEYTDGTYELLSLVNPDNWAPIEQDYFHDGYAFNIRQAQAPRVHLKTGLVTRQFDEYVTINGFSNRIIDGGAANILDLPLNPYKELKALCVLTQSNEVVIGLMAATIVY